MAAADGRIVEYELTISEVAWSPAGRPVRALAINGGVPGPVLRFREGETARIRVHNGLRGEETSIHWHGLLLPNDQDGVPYLTTPPIRPGQSLDFEFPLRQSGTYWYHSHTGLQEQAGVYGAIVVTPAAGEREPSDREEVLVLSDWTNRRPEAVMRSLMAGYDYDALAKGNRQSVAGAARAGRLREFFEREWTRMPPMDISDVAYDAFLINGTRRAVVAGRPGERVRLRLINASASTYFYVESATGPMTIVAADGPPVEPVAVDRLLIGVAETYDVVVTVPSEGSWEVRATAQDGSGHASAWLGSGADHPAADVPKPDLYTMDFMLAGAMEAMGEMVDEQRPLPPYRRLGAIRSTEPDRRLPRREMTLRLTGDMERYLWSFDGRTLGEDSTIRIRRGEVLRIELINDTMMHHPIHLHGHFFRLLEGQGDRAPLKHTVDVPPMGKRTIEFEANDAGDWFFHCHILYHMDAGMARVFSYERPEAPDHRPTLDPATIDPWYWMAEGSIQSHMTEGMARLMDSRNDLGVDWDIGLEHDDDEHEHPYEIDLTWSRYLDPNASAFAGYRLTNEDDAGNRAIAGMRYRLPGLVWLTGEVDSEAGMRLELARELPLTDRTNLRGRVEFDTDSDWRWAVGLEYILTRRWSLVSEYDSAHGMGGGFGFRF